MKQAAVFESGLICFLSSFCYKYIQILSLEGEWKYISNLFSMIPVVYLKIYLHKTNVFMQIHVIYGKHFKWESTLNGHIQTLAE